jgi:outer membrane biosynthesis protein TonB
MDQSIIDRKSELGSVQLEEDQSGARSPHAGQGRAALDQSVIYRKSGLGSAHLAAAHSSALSPRERQVLILVNGRRTIAELTDVFGADTLQRVIPDLEAKGFVKTVAPELVDEWGGPLTRVILPSEEPPTRERSRSPEYHPVLWATLALVAFTFLGSYWAAERYRRWADSSWHFDPPPAPTPIEVVGPPAWTAASTVAVDAKRRGHAAPSAVLPISRLAPATAGETVASEATRAAPAVAPAARRREEAALPGSSQVRVKAAATPDQAIPSAAVATSGEAPPEPTTSVAPSALAAPPAADAASASGTEVASADARGQPTSDPITLRPLRHDPPQIPPQVLASGIVSGHARARLWVTPEGKVDQVDILEATPPGVLDDEVRRVLSLWTYDPPGRPTEDVVELTLKP